MLRSFSVLTVLASALLVSAPDAQAGWKINRATRIAAIVWNNPCPEGALVRWQNPSDVFPAAVFTAFSAPRSWARAGICEVGFDAVFAQRWGFGWDEVCSRMIHEYGHIAGASHSDDPRSVMRRNYDDGAPDPRCRKRGRPYLARFALS